jgi:hypothetical protein
MAERCPVFLPTLICIVQFSQYFSLVLQLAAAISIWKPLHIIPMKHIEPAHDHNHRPRTGLNAALLGP